MKLQLEAIRTKMGFTIKEFAEELKMNPNTYGQYERGQRQLPLQKLEDIANYLGKSTDEVIGREWKQYP